MEVVIAGYQKKNAVLSDQEKRIVAYHEIGPRPGGRPADPLRPGAEDHHHPPHLRRAGLYHAGGRGRPLPHEPRRSCENKIATLTGGRAAEELVFHSVTTGASNDIEQATKLARAMITRYGMSDEFGMVALETVSNQYLGGDASLACSPETQARDRPAGGGAGEARSTRRPSRSC